MNLFSILNRQIADDIIDIIMTHIITRFGLSSTIISDDGENSKVKTLNFCYETYRIRHITSTPYYPQGNGQVEVTNKILIMILLKTVNKHEND